MSSPSRTVFWIENCVHTNTDIYFLYIKKKSVVAFCMYYWILTHRKRVNTFITLNQFFMEWTQVFSKCLWMFFFVIGWPGTQNTTGKLFENILESVSWTANYKGNLGLREESPSKYKPERLKNEDFFGEAFLSFPGQIQEQETITRLKNEAEEVSSGLTWMYTSVTPALWSEASWQRSASPWASVRAGLGPFNHGAGGRGHRRQGALRRER